ncbi:hypothetical protein AB0A77_02110 [Streptomyces varsoviensis]|uniref:aggregation-promoting factor C-terminal-like domain-containing protein n=1 Tax=Streptomyces varsoviensis TaxID=67373 RepID=UPI0033FBA938
MADLDIVGTAAVDVVPIVPGFHNKLKSEILPIADRVGMDAGRRMGERMGDAMRLALSGIGTRLGNDLGRDIARAMAPHITIAVPSAINNGGRAGQRAAAKQGSNAGGAFARSIRTKLEAAFKAMPKLDVKLGDTGVDAQLARIRAKLEQLSNKRVGVDVSVQAAAAEVEHLEEQLRRLGAAHPNVAVRADTATARAALAEIREEIAILTATPGHVRFEVDGALGAKMRAAVEAAQASLPEINIQADTSPARAQIQVLRAQLAALADQRIGIDVDAKTALAKIREIQVKLEELNAKRADIDVRADTAAASAHLAALRAEVAALTRPARIDIDTSGAQGAVLNLAIQIAALAAIPAIPVLAAGVGALAAMFTAAGAGAGAFALAAIPAVKGVVEAVQAQKAAQDDVAKSTDNGARALVQGQQRAIQMASAQQSLAAAHRNAARSIAQASVQVEAAERGVAQASQRAAEQRRQSAEAIRRAQQSLADAERSVERAERSLADANRTALQAQEALTQARKEAADQLRRLDDQVAAGQLDQRDAALRVQEAQQDLQRVMADPRSTELQRQRAQLAFDEAQQHAKEQKRSVEDLQKSAEKQRKAGVEGSEIVKSASERLRTAQRAQVDQAQALADAQRQVAEQTRALAQAQRSAAQAQTDAAQAVSDAQRGVAEATSRAADAQVSAAESVASAERGVASARLSSIDTTTKAANKTDEFRRKLAELTPEQRKLYDSIAGPRGLKEAFKEWQTSLQPQTIPVFTRAVGSLKATLPALRPLVLSAADAIGVLQRKASGELKKPFWQGFKQDIATSVKPAVVGFGIAFGNVIKGLAGIIDAFLPHMDGIVERSDRITGRFAKWGTSLKGSPDFERFLQYVKDTAPGLAQFLGDVMRTMLDVAQAASPMSSTMFSVVTPLLKALSWLATNAPGVVQVMWGLYFVNKAITVGLGLFSAAMGIYNAAVALASVETWSWAAALQATVIVPLIEAIIVVIIALVLAVKYAWDHWDWFHNAVVGAWNGISAAVSFVWTSVLQPVFAAIWTGLKWVGDGAVWLWQNAIGPAFNFIGESAQWLITLFLTILITPMYLAIKSVGGIALWLWNNSFKPAFTGIADGATWLWKNILSPTFSWIGDKARKLYYDYVKPSASGISDAMDTVGGTVSRLWDRYVSPVFTWIGDKASWLYRKGVKPPMDRLMSLAGAVADSFETAKNFIGRAWDKVAGIVKKPIKFVVDVVYNDGIVPVWNAVAKITGADSIKPMKLEGWHTGGIMSGYSPGRDDRVVAVGGGEAIMRPEWTRAVGAHYVNSMNAAARSGGVSGVQQLIGGGLPAFADGGIVGWVKDKVGSAADWLSKGLDYVTDPGKVFDSARAWVVDKVRRISDNPWAKMAAKIPVAMLRDLKDEAISLLGFGDVGNYGANVGKALAWAKTQVGKPYQWGGAGTPSWDCSGFMSGIQKVIVGRRPEGRLWSTFDFQGKQAPPGWVKDLRSPFQIGITNRGKGHTAGTLAGVNVESRSRDGVVVGPRALGAYSNFFDATYGFKPALDLGNSESVVGSAQKAARQMLGEFGWGTSQWSPLKKLWEGESNWRWNAVNSASGAYGIPQALPGSKMAAAGADWRTNPVTQIKWGMDYIKHRPDYGSPAAAYSKWLSRSPHWYDGGGYLQPGLSLVANGTGSPEPVFTSSQWDTLRASGARGAGPAEIHADVKVYVGNREITDIVRTEVRARENATAIAILTGRR